jgi:acyl dehydratase
VFPLDRFAVAMNYGVERVRFPAPLPVGARVRLHARLERVDEVPGGSTLTMKLTFEREGGERPVCVAEVLIRVFKDEDR